MIRYERRKGIKALAYKSFANIKNNIFETLKKPYRLVALAVKTVLPFILFPIMKLATKQEFPIYAEWIFVIIPLALFLVNCYRAFKRVRDTQFTLADVNMLFTSPMPKSLIYMWSMGKSVLFTLFTIGALALAPVIPSLLRTIGLVLAFSALGTQILRCTIYSKDFFEDAANTAVRGKRIKDAVSRRDIDALSTERPTLAVGGSKNVSVNGHYREATAFLWKFILTNKRNARSLFAKTLKTSIFLLASIALGFLHGENCFKNWYFPPLFSVTFCRRQVIPYYLALSMSLGKVMFFYFPVVFEKSFLRSI